jgi:hypothetical protein
MHLIKDHQIQEAKTDTMVKQIDESTIIIGNLTSLYGKWTVSSARMKLT